MDEKHTAQRRAETPVPSPGEIAQHRLPGPAREMVAAYEERVGHRDGFIWKWLWEVFPRFRLSSVPPEYHATVRETKLLLTLYGVLVDDVAKVDGDGATFAAARRVPFSGPSADAGPRVEDPAAAADFLAFTEAVWRSVAERLREAPRHDEFREVFEFDLRQMITAVHHGYLVTEFPELATLTGTETYNQHNMAIFVFTDVDLLFSPGFDAGDLRALRETVWEFQHLGRICNWVVTWERELDEADPTSAVVVEALDRGVLAPEELADPEVSTDELAARIRAAGIEREYLKEWDRRYERFARRSREAATVDLDRYVEVAPAIRDLHLVSRGRI